MASRLLVVILAVACVAGFLAIATTYPAFARSQPFDLSRTLPTGTATSNGQLDCGPNVTVQQGFPESGTVWYWITLNGTGVSVNIWGTSSSSYIFFSTGSPGYSQGTLPGGSYTFVFQACGSTPTVALGFWGYTNYTAPLL
jgi:hypothetical protein